MVSRWVRTWYGTVLRPFLATLAQIGVTPNTVTLISMLIICMAGVLFATGYIIAGTWMLLVGGVLDGLDGELARVSNQQSQFGAFLDSICDHCGDFALYLGLLWHYLTGNHNLEVILIFTAMFSSVFGSQVRSRAGMIGIDTKTIGLFTRFERLLILITGLFFGKVNLALWGLAIFNSLSAIQRVIHTVRAYHVEKGILNSGQSVKP